METENLTTLDDLVWEEEGFWSHESWLIKFDSLTIWKFVVLGVLVGVGGLFLGLLDIEGNEAVFLFNFSYNLFPSGFSTLFLNTIRNEELVQVLGNGSTSDVV